MLWVNKVAPYQRHWEALKITVLFCVNDPKIHSPPLTCLCATRSRNQVNPDSFREDVQVQPISLQSSKSYTFVDHVIWKRPRLKWDTAYYITVFITVQFKDFFLDALWHLIMYFKYIWVWLGFVMCAVVVKCRFPVKIIYFQRFYKWVSSLA